ncbi:MAG: LysE family translocator [Pseudoclavibacter caeni]
MGMDTSQLPVFLVVSLLFVIVPGADWAYILTHATSVREAMASISGLGIGYLAHTLLAAAGLTVALALLPGALPVITVLGAAYLCWLGVQTLRHPADVSLPDVRLPGTATAAETLAEGALGPTSSPAPALAATAVSVDATGAGMRATAPSGMWAPASPQRADAADRTTGAGLAPVVETPRTARPSPDRPGATPCPARPHAPLSHPRRPAARHRGERAQPEGRAAVPRDHAAVHLADRPVAAESADHGASAASTSSRRCSSTTVLALTAVHVLARHPRITRPLSIVSGLLMVLIGLALVAEQAWPLLS